MHETGSDLEQEFDGLLAQDVVVNSKTFRLLHYEFLGHMDLDQLDELLEQNELILRLILIRAISSFFLLLDQEMQ